MSTITNTREQFTAALRALADYIDEHPEAHDIYEHVSMDRYCQSKDEMTRRARELGGRWAKSSDDYSFNLTRTFDPQGMVRVRLTASRATVCTPRVVGTETIHVPDPEYKAPEVPTVAVERDIVEWECPPSLLGVVAVG